MAGGPVIGENEEICTPNQPSFKKKISFEAGGEQVGGGGGRRGGGGGRQRKRQREGQRQRERVGEKR